MMIFLLVGDDTSEQYFVNFYSTLFVLSYIHFIIIIVSNNKKKFIKVTPTLNNYIL